MKNQTVHIYYKEKITILLYLYNCVCLIIEMYKCTSETFCTCVFSFWSSSTLFQMEPFLHILHIITMLLVAKNPMLSWLSRICLVCNIISSNKKRYLHIFSSWNSIDQLVLKQWYTKELFLLMASFGLV